jgi:hypothetical protein
MALDQKIQRRLLALERLEKQARQAPSTYLTLARMRQAMHNLSRQDLLVYLDQAMLALPLPQRHEIFGGLVDEQVLAQLSPEAILAEVQSFHADSLAGKYYAPSDMDSQSFDSVPPETDAWFSEVGVWLDRCCQLTDAGHPHVAKQGLDLLMELINKMNDNAEIVFADEFGDWMIYARYDYEAVWQRLS